MFDPLLPWQAAKAAGMLACASWQPPLGPRKTVHVGFVSPDEQLLGVTAPGTLIEYETADMPDLALDDEIEIDCVPYRVIQTPRKRGDGTFSEVELGER